MVDFDLNGSALLRSVEEMLLPDWQAADCPWCIELDQLASSPIEEGSLLWARRELLRSSVHSSGLEHDLFIPWSPAHTFGHAEGEVLPPPMEAALAGLAVDELELGPRSVFGNLRTEAQVFVAVASAVQELRANGTPDSPGAGLSESFTSPISRVLTPESYLSGRYYAPVILGSILRATRRFDLRATAIESRLRQQVGERLSDPASAARAEILYAIGAGQLPRPSELADPEVMSGGDPSVLEFLRSRGALP
jgi:hypothetical protein